jgi:preprotein translocase subunit SecG
MGQIILVIHVVMAVAIVVLVLLQHGKGADAGAAFGSGASSTVFGSRGSASFLVKVTALLATGFFLTSLTLAMIASRQAGPPASVVDLVDEQMELEETAPEVPADDDMDDDAPPPPRD